MIAGFNQAHDLDLRFRHADTPEFAPVASAKMIGQDVPSPGPEERVLVFESPQGLKVYAFLVDRMLALIRPDPNDPGTQLVATQGRRVQHYHTSPKEAAEPTQRAGIRTLVYTHIIPPLGPPLVRFFVTERFFLRGVGDVFKGEVVIAKGGTRFSLTLK